MTYAAPQYTPAPVQYAAPPAMQYAAAPAYTQPTAFDAVDTNHDGMITRNEFAGVMAPQSMYMQAQAPVYTQPYNPSQLQSAQSMVAYPGLPTAGSMIAYPNAALAPAPTGQTGGTTAPVPTPT